MKKFWSMLKASFPYILWVITMAVLAYIAGKRETWYGWLIEALAISIVAIWIVEFVLSFPLGFDNKIPQDPYTEYYPNDYYSNYSSGNDSGGSENNG